MTEISSKESCERGSELISVLYGEATEHETRDFQEHLRVCNLCQREIASFGQIRESIGDWKFEALSGFTLPQVAMSQQFQRNKSAFAAFREFFKLSPLWLKGATAFATLLFVLFAVLAIVKLNNNEPAITNVKPGAIYTEQEKNLIVQKALDQQKEAILASIPSKTEEPERKPAPVDRPRQVGKGTTQLAKGRPLSRWERDQLAADLRLLKESDDDGLELIGDRINQPED